MKKPKLSKFNSALILICLILLSFVLTITIAGPRWFIRTAIDLTTSQITPADANKICRDFYTDVKAQINAVPGYSVVSGVKSCSPEQDEAGLTDYVTSVVFRVSNSGNVTTEGLKSNVNGLAHKLPKKNYPVFIDNVPAQNGQPAAICVNASRYIDNDGKDYPQGTPGNFPRYTEPGSIKGFAPCQGV